MFCVRALNMRGDDKMLSNCRSNKATPATTNTTNLSCSQMATTAHLKLPNKHVVIGR